MRTCERVEASTTPTMDVSHIRSQGRRVRRPSERVRLAEEATVADVESDNESSLNGGVVATALSSTDPAPEFGDLVSGMSRSSDPGISGREPLGDDLSRQILASIELLQSRLSNLEKMMTQSKPIILGPSPSDTSLAASLDQLFRDKSGRAQVI
jgi:hypothetical protein